MVRATMPIQDADPEQIQATVPQKPLRGPEVLW